MKRIGVIGGIGPESTELFYREIINLCQARRDIKYPNILINSLPTVEMCELMEGRKRAATANRVVHEVEKIQDDVDFIAIPCNTIHFVIDQVRERANVPILGINEEVCKVIDPAVEKVGLLGSSVTIENVYEPELEKRGIDMIVPTHEEIEDLDQIIFEGLVEGKEYQKIKQTLIAQTEHLAERGCDGVILGCTELPLFVTQDDVDVPLYPSTNILAKAAFARAFRK